MAREEERHVPFFRDRVNKVRRLGGAAGAVYGGQRQFCQAIDMPGLAVPTAPLDVVAHVIQVALTPVFLLSGIATLLNVFSTRLARVADLITKAVEGSGGDETAAVTAQFARLRRRSLALDTAVVLAAVAGALTCVSVLTLFVGALKDATVASVLFTTFGLAVICTIAAIGAFAVEMLIAGSGMRAETPASRHSSQA